MKLLRKNICFLFLLLFGNLALLADKETMYTKLTSYTKKHPYIFCGGTGLLLFFLFKYFFYKTTEKSRVLKLFTESKKNKTEVTDDEVRKNIEDILNQTEETALDFVQFKEVLTEEKGEWNNFPYSNFFTYFLSPNNPKKTSFIDFFDQCLESTTLNIVSLIHGLYETCYEEYSRSFKREYQEIATDCFKKLIYNDAIFSNDSPLSEEQKKRILFSYIGLQIRMDENRHWYNKNLTNELNNIITLLINRDMWTMFSVVREQCSYQYDLISPLLYEYAKTDNFQKKENILDICDSIIISGVEENKLIEENFYSTYDAYHHNYIGPFLMQHSLQDISLERQKKLLRCFLHNVSSFKKILYFIEIFLKEKNDPHNSIPENNIKLILENACDDQCFFNIIYNYLKKKPEWNQHYPKYHRNSISSFIVNACDLVDEMNSKCPGKFVIWQEALQPLLKKIIQTLVTDHLAGSSIICEIIKARIRFGRDFENIFTLIENIFSQKNLENINENHKRKLAFALLKRINRMSWTRDSFSKEGDEDKLNEIYPLFDRLFGLFPEYKTEFSNHQFRRRHGENKDDDSPLNRYLQLADNRDLLYLDQNYNLLIPGFKTDEEWANAYNQLHQTIERNPDLETLLSCFSINTINTIMSHEQNQNNDHEAIFNYFEHALQSKIDIKTRINILDFFSKHGSQENFLKEFFADKNNINSLIDALKSAYHHNCNFARSMFEFTHIMLKIYKQHVPKKLFWQNLDTICFRFCFNNELYRNFSASSFYEEVFLPLDLDQEDLLSLQSLANAKQIGNLATALKEQLTKSINYDSDKILKWLGENNDQMAHSFMSFIYNINPQVCYEYAALLFTHAKDLSHNKKILKALGQNQDEFYQFAHLFVQKRNSYHEYELCTYKQFKMLFNKKIKNLEENKISETFCKMILTNSLVTQHIKDLGKLHEYDLLKSYPFIQTHLLKEIIEYKKNKLEPIKQIYKDNGRKIYIFDKTIKNNQRILGFYTKEENFGHLFCKEQCNNDLCVNFLQYIDIYGINKERKKDRELFFYVSLNKLLLKEKYQERRLQAVHSLQEIAESKTDHEKKHILYLADYVESFSKNPKLVGL